MEHFSQFTSQALVFDLILLAVVLVFALLGARRGLVLSLCSLAAVVLALAAACLVSDALTAPLAGQAAPMLRDFLGERLNEWLRSGAQALESADGFLSRIAQGLLNTEQWAVQSEGFLSEFSQAVAEAVIRPVLFLLTFVVALIAWKLISHALDLVARLPVLHTLNTAGGFLFGAVKGGLLLAVLLLAVLAFRPELLPEELRESSRVLAFIQKAPFAF